MSAIGGYSVLSRGQFAGCLALANSCPDTRATKRVLPLLHNAAALYNTWTHGDSCAGGVHVGTIMFPVLALSSGGAHGAAFAQSGWHDST
jgi:hypothetical protein